ncbi:hypothetical protein VUJ46_16305 [Chryseobacterium sp. MYb264]|uniref:hypothetical protein n=1 Tax=Chryseobacterium sp. MYb264 TaxID=2745153 RepID=UPI002E0DA800|nr:hypothetical protein VUJ46_16305 [Chryseobacterium sp. MYb264]
MIEKKLEKSLETFLQENNRTYYKDSINYVGLRKMKMIDNSFRKLHIVSFMVSISDQPYDGDALYSATFDEKTHKMIFILGPQSFEKIEE